jgi:predicted Ser/Thr protein kinase
MVAIKVLPPSVSSDPERRERFEREARAISSLNRPHICALYDLGREETPRGTVDFLVMEYVEGETLAAGLTKGPLRGEQVLRSAAEIADALALADSRGVVHRDLKPGNIVLTRTGIKILDFGLAKLMGVKSHPEGADSSLATEPRELTAPGAILGTLQYMAPEQLEGRECDGITDIFALGAVLYEMATGRKAFEGKSQASVIAAILDRNPTPMSELNPQTTPVLDHIVTRCLAKDPDERWQSAADVALELRWAGDVSSRAPEQPTPVAVLRRRPWVLALTGLSLVALVALGVVAARMTGARPVVPSFRKLTFRRGFAGSARFTPDGKGVIYSAAWEGEPARLFSMRVERPESTRMDFPDAELASVSRSGELLIILGRPAGAWFEAGTLARVPLSGGAPREIARGVLGADWSPDGSSFAVVRQVGGKYRLEYPFGRSSTKPTGSCALRACQRGATRWRSTRF